MSRSNDEFESANEDTTPHRQKLMAKVVLVAILMSSVALGIGLGYAMGLPWWVTTMIICVAAIGVGLGMKLAFKTMKQMQNLDPRE